MTTKAANTGSGYPSGMKNRIINGGMDISQRGTSFAAANGYTLDRWQYIFVTGTGVSTVTQNSDVPSTNEFQNSLRATVTTADTSIAAGELYRVIHRVEGYNARDLIGRTFTLRFWVRSSKTGTHCFAIQNSGSDRSYIVEYNIITANTWEYKTATITGGLITAGTWNYTNGTGIDLNFSLAGGSTYQAAAGAWQTGAFFNTSNQVNCLDTIGNIFAITGVQLELGSIATPFEHRPYGTELALCQRYYDKSFPTGSAPAQAFGRQGALETLAVRAAGAIGLSSCFRFAVPMRITPTVVFYNTVSANAQARNLDRVADCASTSLDNCSNVGGKIYYTLPAGTVSTDLISVHWTAEAEL